MCREMNWQLDRFPFGTQEICIRFGSTLYRANDVLLLNRTDPQVAASFDKAVNALSGQLSGQAAWKK